MPLPYPLDNPAKDRDWAPLSEQVRGKYECFLDDTRAVNVPQPKTREEERELVRKFLSGLDKLFTKENNWAFLQPLVLTMEHCARCQTCSQACHIYEASSNAALSGARRASTPVPCSPRSGAEGKQGTHRSAPHSPRSEAEGGITSFTALLTAPSFCGASISST